MNMRKWLYSSGYRLGQVRQQLGFVAPLSVGEYEEVSQWLPAAALALFKTMSPADQRHSLRVCRGLQGWQADGWQADGCRDMLAAALLHDVGKAQGRVPFWTRPAIVLGKKLAPRILERLVVYPGTQGVATMSLPGWRRALSYAWYHAEVGAELAAEAGLSQRAVLYIRTH